MIKKYNIWRMVVAISWSNQWDWMYWNFLLGFCFFSPHHSPSSSDIPLSCKKKKINLKISAQALWHEAAPSFFVDLSFAILKKKPKNKTESLWDFIWALQFLGTESFWDFSGSQLWNCSLVHFCFSELPRKDLGRLWTLGFLCFLCLYIHIIHILSPTPRWGAARGNLNSFCFCKNPGYIKWGFLFCLGFFCLVLPGF